MSLANLLAVTADAASQLDNMPKPTRGVRRWLILLLIHSTKKDGGVAAITLKAMLASLDPSLHQRTIQRDIDVLLESGRVVKTNSGRYTTPRLATNSNQGKHLF